MSDYPYINDYERDETQKYEGVYTPEEVELNKKLYAECCKKDADFALVEELLQKGADPLGATAVYGWGLLEHVYGEIGLEAFDNDDIDLPRITELFLKYGMDVSTPRVPYDDDNSLHVLRYWPETRKGILALKMLLDHGLDVDSACECWDRFVFGQINCHRDDPNDEKWNETFVWAFKIIMLIASYDHLLEGDEGMQEFICCDRNSYDLHLFREWENYNYHFDTSHCEKYPELYGSIVRIYEKKSGNEVWRMGIGKRGRDTLAEMNGGQ